ncbi:MAG: hypothetical protein ACI8VL_002003 [Bacteroidia bacterium]|jgi:hypothetical protein
MKNFSALTILILACSVAFGQNYLQPKLPGKTTGKRVPAQRPSTDNNRGGGALWTETFTGATDNGASVVTSNGSWVKGGTNGDIWKYSFTPSSGCWSDEDTMPNTSTANTGFLLFDADSVNCQTNQPIGTEDQLYGSITSPIINLTGNPYVLLSFEYAFRYWWNQNQDINFTIDLSGDGGATWPVTLRLDEGDINDFQSGTFEMNVSSVLGGASQAMVRFNWVEHSHYFWIIDDVRIDLQPEHDVRMETTFISHNNSGIQYGIIPSNQTGQAMAIGAEVFNRGYADQTNLNFTADFNGGLFTATDTYALLQTDSTHYMEGTVSPVLTSGNYTGEFEVISDDDNIISINYGNNLASRNLKISCETCWDGLYTLDALPVSWGSNPSQDLGASYPSIGTNSFTDGQDELGLFSLYYVDDPITVSGINILLDTSRTDIGSEVVATLHSVNDFTSIVPEPTDGLAMSDTYTITQQDLNDQSAFIPFQQPYEVSNDSVYGGVFLYSNGGTNNISVLDDESRSQPIWASAISITNQQVYSNGERLAVQLKLCGNSGVTTETNCDSYTWNGNTYTQTGIYGAVNSPGVCETLDLTILQSDPSNILNYDLCPGDSMWYNSTLYTSNTPGQYLENIQNANGCVSIDTVNVSVVNPPSISILGNTNITPNTSETYAFVDPGGYTFTWSAINGTILGGQGTTSIDIFWDAIGGGQVILNLDGQCPTSDTLTVGTFVGIENHWINDLQIHPNPSSGLFNIQLLEATQVTVMDSRGRKVIETTENGRFTVDLSMESTGFYTLRLETETGVGTKRLVKH